MKLSSIQINIRKKSASNHHLCLPVSSEHKVGSYWYATLASVLVELILIIEVSIMCNFLLVLFLFGGGGMSFCEVLKRKLRFFDAYSLKKHFKNLQFLVLAMAIYSPKNLRHSKCDTNSFHNNHRIEKTGSWKSGNWSMLPFFLPLFIFFKFSTLDKVSIIKRIL